MSSNAALKRKEQLDEILNVRGRATPTKKQQEEVADMACNLSPHGVHAKNAILEHFGLKK